MLAVLVWTLGATAQEKKLPMILDIASVEQNDETVLDLFNMPDETGNHYFLCVGTLGFGDDVVQVLFDPVFRLFLPLGSTLDEVSEAIGTLQNLFKEEKNTAIEMPGCLAFGFPNEQLETVTITYRRPILTRYLEFSLQREGYLRATHITRSDFNALASSLKFYRALHKNE